MTPGGQDKDKGAGETDGGSVGGCIDPPKEKEPSDCVEKFYADNTGICENGEDKVASASPSPSSSVQVA